MEEKRNTFNTVTAAIYLSLCFYSFLSPQECIAAIPDTAFYHTFGGPGTEEFRDIAISSDSGFVLAGSTNGYGPGGSSVYVVRCDKSGQHIWSGVYGGHNQDQATCIALTADGSILVGGSSSTSGAGGYDGYLCKLNSSGTKLWEKYTGGSDWDFFNDMLVQGDGSILVCGSSYSNSNGGSDAWILKLDSLGNVIWQYNFGAGGNEQFNSMLVHGSSIFLCGSSDNGDRDGWLVRLDLDGQQISSRNIDLYGDDYLNALAITPAGELIVAGGSTYTDSLNAEFWIQKFDTLFNPGWIITGNSPEHDYMNSVLVKSDGTVIASGMKDPSGFGGKSMFTVQLDASGGSFVPHSFGESMDEETFSCLETIDGRIAFAGYTNSYGNGDLDACLVLLDTNAILPDFVYTEKEFLETLSPIGIENPESGERIFLYPNPVNDIIHFSLLIPYHELSIKIYSMEGRLQFDRILQMPEQNKADLSFLPPGIYLLEIENSGKRYSGKFMKVRL